MEYFGSSAFRDGYWKIIIRGENEDWELYNLTKDRVEMNKLVAENPQKVEEMNATWQIIAEETNVFPAPK